MSSHRAEVVATGAQARLRVADFDTSAGAQVPDSTLRRKFGRCEDFVGRDQNSIGETRGWKGCVRDGSVVAGVQGIVDVYGGVGEEEDARRVLCLRRRST